MTYIEGFVTAVPTANREAYVAHARQAAAMVREFGVARFVETWADDVPSGTVNDLWSAVQAKADEAVLFSWFEYPDKAVRDAATARMMEDPRMADMAKDMPFDGSRMIYGGFAAVGEEGAAGEFGYLDAVVVPVATAKKAAYTAFCHTAAAAFIAAGATRVVDAWGDDVPDGQVTDLKRAVHLTEDESVVFGWVEWPSKDVRDAGWQTVMADERFAGDPSQRGMDGKRMIFGGFAPLLNL
jgi:uncharacterized protein YbaA (DUF1428 family)